MREVGLFLGISAYRYLCFNIVLFLLAVGIRLCFAERISLLTVALYLSVCLSVCLSVYRSVYRSVYLSVYLSPTLFFSSQIAYLVNGATRSGISLEEKQAAAYEKMLDVSHSAQLDAINVLVQVSCYVELVISFLLYPLCWQTGLLWLFMLMGHAYGSLLSFCITFHPIHSDWPVSCLVFRAGILLPGDGFRVGSLFVFGLACTARRGKALCYMEMQSNQ